MTHLFTIPIAGVPNADFKVSSPAQHVYLITFTSGPDNRTTTAFCEAYLKVLDTLEARHEPGVVISTSGIPKFFSNGLDLEHTLSIPRFFPDTMIPLFRRLITYTMPTIALINGHCFGAGVFLASAHDYRFMNPQKGYWCLPEAELGVPIPATLATLIRVKFSPSAYRDAVLEAARYSGPQALERGLVDKLGASVEGVVEFVKERRLVEMSRRGTIAGLKIDAYRPVVEAFDDFDNHTKWQQARIQEEEARHKRLTKL